METTEKKCVRCHQEPVQETEMIQGSCAADVEFQVEGCQDMAVVECGEIRIEDVGRLVQLQVTLREICPNRRIAVAVQLWELDTACIEYPRGIRFFTVPAQSGMECRSVQLPCITFVLPENLKPDAGAYPTLCSTRRFRAKVLAQYVDGPDTCCP